MNATRPAKPKIRLTEEQYAKSEKFSKKLEKALQDAFRQSKNLVAKSVDCTHTMHIRGGENRNQRFAWFVTYNHFEESELISTSCLRWTLRNDSDIFLFNFDTIEIL